MLHGKRVLITGSSQGIGFGVAEAMLRHGAAVVLTSEQPLEACDDVRDLLHRSERATYLQADLGDDEAIPELVAESWNALGGLDVVVNNLGTFREPAFGDISRSDFDRIFGLNVWTALAVSQAFVGLARAARRGGRLLFSSSLNATRSEPGHALYDASKGAIEALVRQLAIELAPYGFTTAAVAPGLVETPLTDFGLQSSPAERELIAGQIPLRRIATVADLAEWYCFLASDAAAYATGLVVKVDGGLDAQQMALRPLGAGEPGGDRCRA